MISAVMAWTMTVMALSTRIVRMEGWFGMEVSQMEVSWTGAPSISRVLIFRFWNWLFWILEKIFLKSLRAWILKSLERANSTAIFTQT